MPSGLTFRTAGQQDLSHIVDLYADLNPDDLPASQDLRRDTFQKMLAQPGLDVILGFQEEVPVTSCVLLVVPNLTRGCAPFVLIENVVTRTDCRGKGIGKDLMRHAVDRAWAAGCFKVMLMSGSANDKAHAFYEQTGFKRSKVGFEIRRPGYPSRRID